MLQATRGLALWTALAVIATPHLQAEEVEADQNGGGQTIFLPKIVMEPRTVEVTEARPVVRTRTVTEMQRVAYNDYEEQLCTEYEYQTRTCKKCTISKKPVFKDVTRCITRNLPYEKTWPGVKTEIVDQTRDVTHTVVVDEGHWEKIPCGCNTGCNKCGQTCARKIWIPNPVEKELTVQVTKKVAKEVPVIYKMTLYRSEAAVVKEKCFCRMRDEKTISEITYQVKVPKKCIKCVSTTKYRYEPVERTETYTVMVPSRVTKTVSVPVCKWVPVTIPSESVVGSLLAVN